MLIETIASLALGLGLAAPPPESQSLTLDQAVQKVQKNTGGRVLSADRVRSRHGRTYRIKTLMDNGRVRVIEVDSQGGGKVPQAPQKKPAKEMH